MAFIPFENLFGPFQPPEPPGPDEAAKAWEQQQRIEAQHEAMHTMQMEHAQRLSDRTSIINGLLIVTTLLVFLFGVVGLILLVVRT